jgi:hypothetical protein
MIEVGTSLGDMHGLSLSYIKRLLDGDEGRPVGVTRGRFLRRN